MHVTLHRKGKPLQSSRRLNLWSSKQSLPPFSVLDLTYHVPCNITIIHNRQNKRLINFIGCIDSKIVSNSSEDTDSFGNIDQQLIHVLFEINFLSISIPRYLFSQSERPLGCERSEFIILSRFTRGSQAECDFGLA